VLGNGGATALWDAFAAGLIRQRSQHVVAGEFGAKFAEAVAFAPFLDDPEVMHADLGRRTFPEAREDVDVYAWPHNETSTGVMTPVIRPEGAQDDQLVVVDGTSAAGGILFDPRQTDVYYFSPQKNFGADGGIWFALMSPQALVRAEEMAGYGRWIPEFFSLTAAMKNSRANQTLNTPAIATLVLMNAQLDWINSNGGLDWAHSRTKAASRVLYEWAEARDEVWPFVIDEAARSQVVVTLDFADHIDAAALAQTLRANGIVDTEPYRKLGRNQLRIATFVSREASDVVALTRCLDYLLDLM
jgi:phosphoserine aminotransferase